MPTVENTIGITRERSKDKVAYALTCASSSFPIAIDALVEPPILIKQPNMANTNVIGLIMFIAASASLPYRFPVRRLFTNVIIVVPKIEMIVGVRYFFRVFLIK